MRELLHGIEDIATLAATTYGPQGRSVWIDRPQGTLITRDGYMVVREAVPYGEYPRCLGGKILLDGLERQNLDVGDGTTLTSILSGALARECRKHEDLVLDPEPLIRQIPRIPLESVEVLYNLAERSVHEVRLAHLVVDLLMDLGEGAHIVVEPGWHVEHQTSTQVGSRFTTRAYREATLDQPLVAVFRHGLAKVEEIQDALEWQAGSRRPLLLVAPWVEGAAMDTLRMNPQLEVLAVRQGRIALEDLAALTGATVHDPLLGKFDRDYFGHAVQATADRTGLTVIPYEDRDVSKLAASLREQAEHTESPFDADRLRERASALQTSIGFLRVEATTDLEGRETKSRVEDLLGALRSTLRDGTTYQAASVLQTLQADPVTRKILSAPAHYLGPHVDSSLVDPYGVVTGALRQAYRIAWAAHKSGVVVDLRGRPTFSRS